MPSGSNKGSLHPARGWRHRCRRPSKSGRKALPELAPDGIGVEREPGTVDRVILHEKGAIRPRLHDDEGDLVDVGAVDMQPDIVRVAEGFGRERRVHDVAISHPLVHGFADLGHALGLVVVLELQNQPIMNALLFEHRRMPDEGQDVAVRTHMAVPGEARHRWGPHELVLRVESDVVGPPPRRKPLVGVEHLLDARVPHLQQRLADRLVDSGHVAFAAMSQAPSEHVATVADDGLALVEHGARNLAPPIDMTHPLVDEPTGQLEPGLRGNRGEHAQEFGLADARTPQFLRQPSDHDLRAAHGASPAESQVLAEPVDLVDAPDALSLVADDDVPDDNRVPVQPDGGDDGHVVGGGEPGPRVAGASTLTSATGMDSPASFTTLKVPMHKPQPPQRKKRGTKRKAWCTGRRLGHARGPPSPHHRDVQRPPDVLGPHS